MRSTSVSRLLAAASIAASALLLTGCMIGPSSDPTDPDGGPQPSSVNQPTTVPPGGGLGTSAVPESPTPPEAFPTEAPSTSLARFGSPTGNIGCVVDLTSARCDIAVSEFDAPPKPPTCTGAWGRSVAVGVADPAAFTCVSDTALGPPFILDYGASVTVGPFLCSSTRTAMICRNTETGHGFTMSRAAVTVS